MILVIIIMMMMMLENDRKFKECPLFVQTLTSSHVLPKCFRHGVNIPKEFKSGEVEVLAQEYFPCALSEHTSSMKLPILKSPSKTQYTN